jgi:hypothetical protein
MAGRNDRSLRVLRWARPLVLGLLAPLGLLSGCDGHRPELANAVQAVASAEGAAFERTLVALLAQGPATLPFIEAGLHRSAASERFNLIVALRRLGLVESVPLLAQVASFDRDLRVAREAWETLSVWSAATTPRGQAARQALRKVDEQRGDLFEPVQLTRSQASEKP